jgi:hypothetical protein
MRDLGRRLEQLVAGLDARRAVPPVPAPANARAYRSLFTRGDLVELDDRSIQFGFPDTGHRAVPSACAR